MGITRDFTAPYTAAEAFFYDALVAPAVERMVPSMSGMWLDEVPHGARVLDVGCGGGQNLLAIAALRPDLQLCGLDLNPGQVGRARRRAAKRNVPAEIVEGSALELPFDDGEFDTVMSIASIKHWPDRALGLSECTRVLAPGGLLFVVEADRGCYLDDARSFVAGMRLPRAFRRMVLMGFRTYVAGQGLDLDDARGLAESLPLAERRVERLPGAPAVAIIGRK